MKMLIKSRFKRWTLKEHLGFSFNNKKMREQITFRMKSKIMDNKEPLKCKEVIKY